MFEKWFPKHAIESYLEKYTETWKSILDDSYLKKQIDILARKGKSKRYIYQKLWETKQDRQVLENLLNEYFIDGEQENIIKNHEKLKNKYPQQKIIQKLIEKGFSYSEIKGIVK